MWKGKLLLADSEGGGEILSLIMKQIKQIAWVEHVGLISLIVQLFN